MAATRKQIKHTTPTDARINQVWSSFDFNGNGFLSLAEIDRAVLEIMPEVFPHKPAIMRAYKAADVSKDGYIQKHEFKQLLNMLGYFDELFKMFQHLDKNGDRRLSFAEFKEGHNILGLNASDADLHMSFDKLDSNHGGYLLFDEFVIFFSKQLAK